MKKTRKILVFVTRIEVEVQIRW